MYKGIANGDLVYNHAAKVPLALPSPSGNSMYVDPEFALFYMEVARTVEKEGWDTSWLTPQSSGKTYWSANIDAYIKQVKEVQFRNITKPFNLYEQAEGFLDQRTDLYQTHKYHEHHAVDTSLMDYISTKSVFDEQSPFHIEWDEIDFTSFTSTPLLDTLVERFAWAPVYTWYFKGPNRGRELPVSLNAYAAKGYFDALDISYYTIGPDDYTDIFLHAPKRNSNLHRYISMDKSQLHFERGIEVYELSRYLDMFGPMHWILTLHQSGDVGSVEGFLALLEEKLEAFHERYGAFQPRRGILTRAFSQMTSSDKQTFAAQQPEVLLEDAHYISSHNSLRTAFHEQIHGSALNFPLHGQAYTADGAVTEERNTLSDTSFWGLLGDNRPPILNVRTKKGHLNEAFKEYYFSLQPGNMPVEG